MGKIESHTGNSAAAAAFRQVNPDVVAAYPITPSTDVVEIFSKFAADGLVQTEFVTVESEHSAMSACIGASAAGVRVMTATSSQGLMLMSELLYIASGLRLPLVMALSNRAISAPLNIHGDHSDAMATRDSGWIQIFCKNAQEIYDTVFQAVRISEHPEVQLPVMVCYDGFTLSHTLERVTVSGDPEVRYFIGSKNARYPLLDSKKPVTYGPVDLPDYYTEHKRQQAEAMKKSLPVISAVGLEFWEKFGRGYDVVEPYFLEDADVILVLLGSSFGAAQEAVDLTRRHGLRTGVLRIRSYRPFPYEAVSLCLKNAQAIAVLDRFPAAGGSGPLFQDVVTSVYTQDNPSPCLSFIGGLGGRDLSPETFRKIFIQTEKSIGKEAKISEAIYFDVREHNAVAEKV